MAAKDRTRNQPLNPTTHAHPTTHAKPLATSHSRTANWASVSLGRPGEPRETSPSTGGFLLERFWWGSVFLIDLPVIALFLVFAPILLREVRATRSNGGRDGLHPVIHRIMKEDPCLSAHRNFRLLRRFSPRSPSGRWRSPTASSWHR
ncbi:hypothetical protein [Streptomyces sirii]|uniref:hypothetical protein n=1 Tax=Streptomyces sirii TaxID=3127701 RepID=UPI003D35F685